ncbi:hypothetical protein ABZW10_33035 [Kitasatospora sp. NPDC004723]|uniref:hypothetical protein n=1 Tax=Kitasatospora sp. NPDC004723 TaxID=3154288 RepID=UPI0033B6176F
MNLDPAGIDPATREGVAAFAELARRIGAAVADPAELDRLLDDPAAMAELEGVAWNANAGLRAAGLLDRPGRSLALLHLLHPDAATVRRRR